MRLYNGVELHLLSRLEKEAHANGISHPFHFPVLNCDICGLTNEAKYCRALTETGNPGPVTMLKTTAPEAHNIRAPTTFPFTVKCPHRRYLCEGPVLTYQ